MLGPLIALAVVAAGITEDDYGYKTRAEAERRAWHFTSRAKTRRRP